MKNTKCTDNYNEASGVEISDKVDEAKKYVNKLFAVDLVKNQVLDALKYKFGISFHVDSGKWKNNKVLHKACLLINVTPYSMKNEELRDKSELDIEFICSKLILLMKSWNKCAALLGISAKNIYLDFQ